jgi:hypothetical protein
VHKYKETKMALNLTTTANPVRTWKKREIAIALAWSLRRPLPSNDNDIAMRQRCQRLEKPVASQTGEKK